MKIALIFLSLIVQSAANAQEVPPEFQKEYGDLVESFSKYREVLNSIKTIEYNVQGTMTRNPNFSSVESIKQAQTKCELHFIGKGEKFWFLIDPFQVDRQQALTNELSFDGERIYRLYPNTGQLLLTTSSIFGDYPAMWDYATIFRPFVFLMTDFQKGDGRISNYTDTIKWDNWIKSAKIESITEVDQKKCLVVACSGDDRTTMFSRKVYFCISDNYYPIRIDTYRNDGQLRNRYKVNKIGYVRCGENTTFPFPETSSEEWSADKNNLTMWTSQCLYSSTVNIGHDISQDTFTIDPIRATEIHDEENKTTVKVPK